MSFVLLGILNSQAAGAGGVGGYIAVLGGANNEYGKQIAQASNLFLGILDQTNDHYYLAEYDENGDIVTQKTVGVSDGYENTAGEAALVADSSNNLYIPLSDTVPILVKLNSSGAVSFTKSSTGYGTRRVAISSADKLILAGSGLVSQVATDGSIDWARSLTGTSNSPYLTTDSSNNAIGLWFDFDGYQRGQLLKFNSSGTLQWQKRIDAGANFYGYIATDSSDNIYVAGFTGAGGLMKFNSSGTLQWYKTGLFFRNVTVDANDDVYVSWYSSPNSGWMKLDSSGNILIQRSITEMFLGGYLSLSGDFVYLSGNTSIGEANNNSILLKLPTDGSGEGTYDLDGNSIVYAASSQSLSTGSPTITNESASASTTTPSVTTETNASLATSSLVEDKINI